MNSITGEEYRPPVLFRNAHLSTMAPALMRRVREISYTRQTIETPDDDFLDLDIYSKQQKKAVILLHGLEGSSNSAYMLGMARALTTCGLDVIAMNQRGCSDRMNRLPSAYHSGKSDDLNLVVDHFSKTCDQLFIAGFSLGGNIALKWAGEYGVHHTRTVKAVAAVSVPCDLAASGERLSHWRNRHYLVRFLRQLKGKVAGKITGFPDMDLTLQQLARVRTFRDFDDLYTAPFHGFRDAADYYRRCSAQVFIPAINIPTLLINALNDPFLTESCHAREACAANPMVRLLTPEFGGHVGFASNTAMTKTFWHEQQVCAFFSGIR